VPVFGNNSIAGTSVGANGQANVWWMGKFTLAAASDLTAFNVYLSNVGSGHVACNCRLGIYKPDGAAGKPSTLVGVTDALAVADSAAAGWKTPTGSILAVPAGDYWFGGQGDANAAGLNMYYVATGGIDHVETDTYSDGAQNPLNGSVLFDGAELLSIYCTATAVSASGIGKLAWWLNSFKWHSNWEPRSDRLILPKRGGLLLPEPVF
jgi:hypothetical protein